MRIKFLRDFRGVETRENYFQAGQVVDVEDGIGSAVCSLGVAELTNEDLTAGDEPVFGPAPKAKKAGRSKASKPEGGGE